MTSPHTLLSLLAHLALEPIFTSPYAKPTTTPKPKPKRARKLRNKRKHESRQRRRNRHP